MRSPNTRAAFVVYCCLVLLLPDVIYEGWHRITGLPIDYQGLTAVILGALATFGMLVGCPLLGIEMIRSMRSPREPIGSQSLMPRTHGTNIALGCLLLVLPLIVYKAWYRMTGQPINYRSTSTVILGFLAMFGYVAGFGLLGIQVLRSARTTPPR